MTVSCIRITFLLCLLSHACLVGSTPADEVVTTGTGASLKIVVRRDCAIHATPDRKGASQPARTFEFYYVLAPEKDSKEKLKGDFYRIATGITAKDAVGWIHKDDVVEWPHRQALGLRPIAGRERARFYKSLGDLKAAYQAGGAKGPEPISVEQTSSGIGLMPILDQVAFKFEGDDVAGYRVAYLHARPDMGGGSATGSGTETAVDLSKATLDVVFVIDTTKSMQPHIDAMKRVVTEVKGKLAGNKALTVRFGLVAYRDTIASPPPDWYVTKLVCDLKTGADHAAFQRLLDETNEAKVGSEDTPEDVLAGLKIAIKEMDWNPDGFKNIVLIGDASAHLDGPKNSQKETIAGLLSLAQPTGRESVKQKIAIHTIRIVSNDPTDHATCDEHFKRIAQGRDYPTPPHTFDGKATPDFIAELVGFLSKATVGLVEAKSGKPIPKDTPALGLLLDMVGSATEAATGAPTFASGFASEIDRKGHKQLEPHVLVKYGQMELFRSALNFCVSSLKNAGEPGSKDVKILLQSMQILATQVNMGEPVDPNTSPATILKYILGFPVRNKIFNMSFAKLAAMTDSDYQSWVKEVEASESIVKGHLDNRKIWFNLGKDANPEKRHGFLKVTDLP